MNLQRYQRICHMPARRAPDLSLCMKPVYQPHAVAVIIRSADAPGVHQTHAVCSTERMRTVLCQMAGKDDGLTLQTHSSVAMAAGQIKQQDMQMLTTGLSHRAVDFRPADDSGAGGIFPGEEKKAISDSGLVLTDPEKVIPMSGMALSLHVPLAGGLILHAAQRQRQNTGRYQRKNSAFFLAKQLRLLSDRGFPVPARVAQGKRLAYPLVNKQGEIVADGQGRLAVQALAL